MSGELVTFENTALQTVDRIRADEHPADVYTSGLSSERSRAKMEQVLDNVARLILYGPPPDDGEDERPPASRYDIPWQEMRFQHVQRLRGILAESYSLAYANLHLTAVRRVIWSAWQLGMMTAEDMTKATSVKNVRGETVPKGRDIPAGERVALLNTCEDTAGGIRDAAILSIGYSCGLRRAEIVGLDLADYDPAAGMLKVTGKGRKERLVPVTNGAKNALEDWLAVRGDIARPGELAVFVGVGNRQRGRRLTKQAIYNMMTTRAALAGIPELSPHDFRRTFVGDLLDAGVDIATVQKMAGHADPKTTARYDRRGDRAKVKASQLLHVPYRKRTLAEK